MTFMPDLCEAGVGFPDPDPHHPCENPGILAFCVKHLGKHRGEKLACGIPGSRNNWLELPYTGNHRIIPVQYGLVIETFNDGGDCIIVNKDTGGFFHLSFNPYFNPPPVAMEMRTLPAIMHEPVASVKMDRLVNSGIHQ
jgi:hypothetical protein